MFNHHSPSKYSPFAIINLSRLFSTAQKLVDFELWTCWFWCLLVVLFFVSHLSNWQNVPIWGLFSSEKKVTQGYIKWTGRVEHGSHDICCQKQPNTQLSVGRSTHKSPIMKWVKLLKESSKNSLKLNAGSHNTTSWYTDTDGFLEHSPSRGSLYYKGLALQEIIVIILGSLLIDLF